MEASKIVELQDDIVFSIAELIPAQWTMLVLNFEVLEGESSSPVTDRICFWVNDSKDGFKNENLSITIEIEDKLLALRQAVKEGGQSWDVCDLTIISTGKYEFKFSYDGPRRLLGEFDFESMFKYDSHREEYGRRKELFS